MLIHAYRRKEPVDIELFGLTVEFRPNEVGHMVSVVTHEAAVGRLLSIAEAYRAYGSDTVAAPLVPTIQPSAADPSPGLLGSSLLPSEIELADDRFVTLGDVVRAAFERTGLTLEGWNNLPEVERNVLLNSEVESLRSGLKTSDEDDLALEEAERQATAKALADAEAADAAAKAAAQPAEDVVSLVLTNDAGETLDLSAWTAKQVRAFATDANVALPAGNSTPIAELRQLLAKGLTAKSAA